MASDLVDWIIGVAPRQIFDEKGGIGNGSPIYIIVVAEWLQIDTFDDPMGDRYHRRERSG